MQSTARKNELPLDKMCLVCEVTKKITREEIPSAPKDGANVHGLYMEVTYFFKVDFAFNNKCQARRLRAKPEIDNMMKQLTINL